MEEVRRISPQEAREKVVSGSALLTCAYEDEGKCHKILVEGAMTNAEFQIRLPSLAKDQELIFYCA